MQWGLWGRALQCGGGAERWGDGGGERSWVMWGRKRGGWGGAGWGRGKGPKGRGVLGQVGEGQKAWGILRCLGERWRGDVGEDGGAGERVPGWWGHRESCR